MKLFLHLVYGLCGAILALVSTAYLAGIANVSLAHFGLALWKLLPIMLLTGMFVGICTHRLTLPGCLTVLVAGLTAMIGAVGTAIAEPQTPVSRISVAAYATGIPISLLISGTFLLLCTWLRDWFLRRWGP